MCLRILVEAGSVLLVARQAANAFDEDDVALATSHSSLLLLKTLSPVSVSYDALVREMLNHKPTLLFGMTYAQVDLVLDGKRVLEVRAIAGIDENAVRVGYPTIIPPVSPQHCAATRLPELSTG